ncbi:MAG: FadR/GntR family transcriptional regulator [Pseudomonadota bacterium]
MRDSSTKRGAADIAADLKRSIMSGELMRDEKLPAERELADANGVARGTVRAALRKLADDELIEIRHGSGVYVRWENPNPVQALMEAVDDGDLLAARLALEPELCRLAAASARAANIETMARLCVRMEAATGEPSTFLEADASWHAALARCTGNRLMIGMFDQISAARRNDRSVERRRDAMTPDAITAFNAQHRQILAAIRVGDGDRASMLMKRHLEASRANAAGEAQPSI